jgi:DNA-binding transcriptional LysR family regulator
MDDTNLPDLHDLPIEQSTERKTNHSSLGLRKDADARIYSPAVWSELRVFLAAAKMGSFSGGAKLIGTSQPSVSRQISSLEKHLGQQLFVREAQGVRLTQAGRELAAQTAQLDLMISRLTADKSIAQAAVRGEVKLAASTSILSTWVIPFLPRLQKEYPQIRVEVFSSDTLFGGRVPPAEIVLTTRYNANCTKACKRVGFSHLVPFVSRSYASRRGLPRRSQLEHHSFIKNRQFETNPELFEDWELARALGATSGTTKLSLTYIQMIRAGLGTGLLENFHALDPELMALDWEMAVRRDLYLYCSRDDSNQALHAVCKFMTNLIRTNPWFQETMVTHSRDIDHSPVARSALSRQESAAPVGLI